MSESKHEPEKKFHLTKDKRVPKCYKEVEKVLRSVKSCQGNIKTVMYNSRLRGGVFNKVYALSFNVLKYRHVLEKIIEETELLEKEPFLRKELAGIMIYEILFGKGLPGESKPVMTIKKYQDEIEKLYRNSLATGNLNLTDVCRIPKYVRVNTLVTSVYNVLKDLEQGDYQEIKVGSNATFDEYLDKVKTLESGCFLVDYHFKDLLVFANDENLSSWPLYRKQHVFIQDKSSYIPVYALNPESGSAVLDACAAPGMKTSHIAAVMENKGKIFAFEKNEERFEVLKQMTESACIKICSSKCKDFYTVDCFDPKFESVQYILVDPTCSGSGMVNRMDSVTDTKDSKNDLRIKNLAGFQIMLLKHALAFPNVKRVVYSTCSVTEEENEFVVHEVLAHFRYHFKLVPVMPDWPIRGSDNFEFGNLCVRAYPKKSLTNGFFVAMFERMSSEEQEQYKISNFVPDKNSKFKSNKFRKCKIKSDSCEEKEKEYESSNVQTEILFQSHTTRKRKSKNRSSNPKLQEEEPIQKKSDFVDVLFSNSSDIKEEKLGKRKSKSKPEEKMEQVCENSGFASENSFLDSHKSESSKSKKKKKDCKLLFTEEEQYENLGNISEKKVSEKNIQIVEKKKHKKNHDNKDNDLLEVNEENIQIAKKKKHKKNHDNKDNDLLEISEENIQIVKKKKHKKNHDNNAKDLLEVTEFTSKVHFPLPVSAVQEECGGLKKKQKKKRHSKSIET